MSGGETFVHRLVRGKEHLMKRTVLLFLTVLTVLLAVGCGKNKDEKKKKNGNPTEVTETPTEEPTLREYTEYYAGTVNCQSRGAVGKVWSCKGTMTFSSKEGGKGDAGRWEIPGVLTSYVLTASDGSELARISPANEGNSVRYTLLAGGQQKDLGTYSADGTFTVYSCTNRLFMSVSGEPMLMIAAETDRMVLSFRDGDGYTAFSFAVKQFAVTNEMKVYHATTGDLAAAGDIADCLEGEYLKEALREILTAGAYTEWPTDYLLISGMRIARGNSLKTYTALYRGDSVIVEDGKNGVFLFGGLSEGTPEVNFYHKAEPEDILERTYASEELDGYRTEIFGEETAAFERDAEYHKGLVPMCFTVTEEGFTEKGINPAQSGSMYLRLWYAGDRLTGDITARFSGNRCDSVLVGDLTDSFGNVLISGDVRRDGKVINNLVVRKRDEYGIVVSEERSGQTVTYEYLFSEAAFGGEDDTVRHEWIKLLPYLEANVKNVPDTGKDDDDQDGEDGEDGENADEGKQDV